MGGRPIASEEWPGARAVLKGAVVEKMLMRDLARRETALVARLGISGSWPNIRCRVGPTMPYRVVSPAE